MSELPKTFDPAAIEARWYQHWESKGLFRPERPGAEPWTIVNPPPNVTGSLHIGHALDNTLQDILVRHARLQGKDARWVVGMDHAGIATQMVVERQMALHQQKRTDFTREQFVDKVWEWKAESGGQITGQLRRLGCSMDWANERFTMDEGFTKAVLKVFVQLYREGLLYRDKRLVNWDPALSTAISDLEVETREVKGKFWHLRYSLEDGSGHISVATTRPETMLADMAVAVNPEDERYTALIGKKVRLPITGRLVPIVADEHADPELGSGAVKITPGHDFNDFDVGVRAGIKPAGMLNMLDAKAAIAQTADGLIPADLIGLDRFEARDRIVKLLEEEGALEQVEDRVIQTPYGDRSGVVIEPWLTDQWYVDAATLAKPAIEAVRSGKTKIVPATWEKTFFHWMENIQPWCVSRQLWWGHQIPAWFGPKKAPEHSDATDIFWTTQDEPFVAVDEEELRLLLADYYGADSEFVFVGSEEEYLDWDEAVASNSDLASQNKGKIPIYRDPDVLDTWFSSALWPFATMGWPDDISPPPSGEGFGVGESGETSQASSGDHTAPTPTPPLKGRGLLGGRYPNDVLISGFDILFFWDARMMMQGLHFMGEVPFRTLYLHGLVRAPDGAKMSKSKGNTVDPLGLIDRYGADALRFFMAAMESQGRDIKMDEKRVEGYRNFATKLWNAARFCQANGIGGSAALEPPAAGHAVNRWIIGETVKTVQAMDLALAELRFDEAANAIYQFVWATFCDWYVELIKPLLSPLPFKGGDQGVGASGEAASPSGSPTPNPSLEREGLETRTVAGWVLDQILVMLHPFMPFVTEELWHALAERDHELIVARWPMPDARAIDPEAGPEVDWLIRLVSGIRAARAELSVPPGARLALHVRDADDATKARLERHHPAISRLARIADITHAAPPAGGSAQIIVDFSTYVLPLAGIVDIEAEKARLEKTLQATVKERDSLMARLGNPSFVERAKPEAVEKARADHAERAAEAERLEHALARIG